jgi:hypothetical protein
MKPPQHATSSLLQACLCGINSNTAAGLEIKPFSSQRLVFLCPCPAAQPASRETANQAQSFHTTAKARIILRTSFPVINSVSLNELVIGRRNRCLSAGGGGICWADNYIGQVTGGEGGTEVKYIRDAMVHFDLAGLDTGP